jgi:hypothetical protein
MSYNTIYKGQRVVARIEYRLNGVPTDPTIAQVSIKTPTGSTVTLTYPETDFVRTELGVFEVYYTLDESGTWWFRSEGAGVVDGVDEMSVSVANSVF